MAVRYCNTIKGNDRMAKVKDRYFSVIMIGRGEPRKFFVALRYLSHPPFLKLLDAAEREFGFNQGILVIPCGPSELQRILRVLLAELQEFLPKLPYNFHQKQHCGLIGQPI